tara:strand:- start:306 stop:1490 length:1185 start_codon:yes stop_codon:yes gene_type:complete
MTKFLPILLFFLSIVPLFGQSVYSEIDQTSKQVPKQLKSAAQIAAHLTRDLKKEEDKVRAIYIWITHNIQYDMTLVKNPVTYTEQINIADEALKNRKGVCEHYAQLFQQMCAAIGITSYVIPGYTRQSDGHSIDPLNHAWNGVVVNNNYYLLDPTWDAGYYGKGSYVHEFQDEFFLVEPKTFIKTHVPFDPIWQFLDNPISHSAFKSKDLSKLAQKGDFAYRDSIANMGVLDSIGRIESTNKRISAFGITNELIREELSENENLLEYYKYNAWVSAYNAINRNLKMAVDEINLAVTYHNAFYKLAKNNQGSIPGENGKLETNLNNALKHLAKGQELLNIAVSQIGLLEYLGKNKEHLQNSKSNKKSLLAYMAQLKDSMLKLELSIKKNRAFYKY